MLGAAFVIILALLMFGLLGGLAISNLLFLLLPVAIIVMLVVHRRRSTLPLTARAAVSSETDEQ